MELLKQKLEEILGSSGLNFGVEVDPEGCRVNIFINYEDIVKGLLPKLIAYIENVVKILARKYNIEKVNVDVNNYKKERERLLAELAKAAARKVLVEKKEIALPAMNAYERRIVHVELATRPDVKTESVGEGSERHIVVKPL